MDSSLESKAITVYVNSFYRILGLGLTDLLARWNFKVVTNGQIPEVALVDLSHLAPPYPPPLGVPTLALIQGSYTEAKAALTRGYKGYLTRDSDPELLPKALQAIAKGEIWAERKLIAELLEIKQEDHLTERELEVYSLIQQGLNNQSIAQQLHLSVSTVKGYITSLMHKLNVKSRLELATRRSRHHP